MSVNVRVAGVRHQWGVLVVVAAVAAVVEAVVVGAVAAAAVVVTAEDSMLQIARANFRAASIGSCIRCRLMTAHGADRTGPLSQRTSVRQRIGPELDVHGAWH
jgi:hypothetical protein